MSDKFLFLEIICPIFLFGRCNIEYEAKTSEVNKSAGNIVPESVTVITKEPVYVCDIRSRAENNEIKQKINTEVIHIALVCPCDKDCECDKDCKCDKNKEEINCCQQWRLPFLFHKS